MSEIAITGATLDDRAAILELYRAVASVPGGLARTADEISGEYVSGFLEKSISNGVIVIGRDAGSRKIVGEIHGYRLGPSVFGHVLGDLTIAVDPGFQGRGIGRRIFAEFMRRVIEERPEIERVELIARESNAKAIRFYESLGFAVEGRLERRIRSGGGYEADIPMAWLRADPSRRPERQPRRD